MAKAVLFAPSDIVINSSLDARKYLDRLSRRLDLERRSYETAAPDLEIGQDVGSVAVLAALSALEQESGYVEMDLDTIFQPAELLRKLRAAVSRDFPIVAIVDDVYSDYIMGSYLRAGASAVVGTNGALFGMFTSRIKSWDQVVPYINAFERV